MYSYGYSASENTTSQENPGKAYVNGVLCNSFVTFPGMLPYSCLLCYIPWKEVAFYSTPHVPLVMLTGQFGSGWGCVFRNGTS